MPRVYVRKFDWDEAERLRADGLSLNEVARRLGVSAAAVHRATDPLKRQIMQDRVNEWIRSGSCPDCGAQTTRRSKDESARCQACAARLMATSVRPKTLWCSGCLKWKPDASFPGNRSESARRGRHQTCRGCGTVARTEYRNRHRVPCTNCGKLRMPPSEATAGPARKHLKDTGLCKDCYIDSVRRVA